MDTPALTPCPFCGAQARVVPDAQQIAVCGVCGAPRLGERTLGPRDREQLQRAALLTRSARASMAGAWLAWALAALVGIAGVATLAAAASSAGVLLLIAAVLAFGASYALRKAQSARKQARTEIGEAWQRAALAVLRDKHALSETQLATELQVPIALAAQWLQALLGTPHVRLGDANDDGELTYVHTAPILQNAANAASSPRATGELRARVESPENSAEIDELREFDEKLAAQIAAGPRTPKQTSSR